MLMLDLSALQESLEFHGQRSLPRSAAAQQNFVRHLHNSKTAAAQPLISRLSVLLKQDNDLTVTHAAIYNLN